MNEKGFTLIELLIVVGILFLIPLGPMIFIWALNTLFSLAIPHTLETWFAAAAILLLLKTNISFTSRSK